MPRKRPGVSRVSKSNILSNSSSKRLRTAVSSNILPQRRADVAARRKVVAEELRRKDKQRKMENDVFVDSIGGVNIAFDLDGYGGLDDVDDVPWEGDVVENEDIDFDGVEIAGLLLHQRKGSNYRKGDEQQRKTNQDKAWSALYPELVDVFLLWSAQGSPVIRDDVSRHIPVQCFNLHSISVISFPTGDSDDENCGLVSTMLRHGYIAATPLAPKTGVSMELLELFSALNGRCGNVGITPFVRSICDLQKTLFHRRYSRAFSRAYDVYMELLYRIDRKLDDVLQADKISKLQEACPCCMVKVSGDDELKYPVLICVDGNESLKRHRRLRRTENDQDKVFSIDIELKERPYRDSYLYVEEDIVDKYKNEVKKSGSKVSLDKTSTSRITDNGEATPIEGVDSKTPCTDRWSNLSADSKKRMWGTFDETGIFIATCRHGVVLSICDMVKSGELAKYPLALLDDLIDVVGRPMLCGYDIGCGFSKTLQKSALVGPKARQSKTSLCVNAFHGHAHCRTCQLDWHPLYIEGAGLEDFEACERVFAQSNRIAGCTRHMSKFHRRQSVERHFKRWNLDKYSEVSTFLLNNLRQARQNIDELTRELITAKSQLGITSDDVFVQWRDEEQNYLQTLQSSAVSIVEQLEMDYINVLKRLKKAEDLVEARNNEFIIQESFEDLQKSSYYRTSTSKTTSIEEATRSGLDSLLALQDAARRLEDKLMIKQRWTETSDDWKRVDVGIAEQNYRKAIDRLEGLVVARLFELSKMSQAGTGYKLRVQISKALQSRSETIRTALKAFNVAAGILGRPTLSMSTILDYVFLGQFDLLRGSRSDVLSKPWAHGVERAVMTTYFKIQRSHEEMLRVRIEMRRLETYICESEDKLSKCYDELKQNDPLLAMQLKKQYDMRRQINEVHKDRLSSASKYFKGTTMNTRSETVVDESDIETVGDVDESNATSLDITFDVLGH